VTLTRFCVRERVKAICGDDSRSAHGRTVRAKRLGSSLIAFSIVSFLRLYLEWVQGSKEVGKGGHAHSLTSPGRILKTQPPRRP
jgi:hypothetical protein